MAMPAALARYWRNKRGHRKSGGRHRRSSSKALVRHVHHYPKRKARGRRRGGGGGGVGAMGLIPVVGLAAALGYGTSVKDVVDALKKVPGVKTFGAPLVVGGVAYAINEFIYPNKWLRLAAAIGLTIGAFQLGAAKFDISWVGDVADADGMVADVR